MTDLPPLLPRALCRASSAADWDEGGREWLAKAICSGCPEIEPCREYALSTRVKGVWGGLNASERGALRSGMARRGQQHYTKRRAS